MAFVREARPSDAEAIADIHVAAIEAFGPEAYDEAEVEAWASREDPPEDHYTLDDPDAHWIVAERDGERAGFGHLDPKDGEIVAVYVHPDHARHGVGSTILAGLEGYARGVGLAEVTLTASLNAVPFYERTGYERVRPVVHETSTGVALDCVEMGKSL